MRNFLSIGSLALLLLLCIACRPDNRDASITMTPTPLVKPMPATPTYYKQHPALYPLSSLGAISSCCEDETWRLIEQTKKPASTANNVEIALSVVEKHPTSVETGKVIINDSQMIDIIAPNEMAATLVLSKTEQLGEVVRTNQSLFGEFSVDGDVFSYTEIDEHYLIIHGFCYGDGSIAGLHVIDEQKLRIYTVSDFYAGNCEGGVEFSISPDKQYLIYDTTVVTLTDGEQIQLCAEGEFARSYVWSPDGRYVYVSCGSLDIPDQLYRYDTLIWQEILLTNRDHLPFKASQMHLSPNQNQIVFVWRNSDFATSEDYGLWVLDLTQLGGEK